LTYLSANFINFLKLVGVPTVSTLMTFGVSRDKGAFEWAGTSLDSVFAQRSNIFSISFWRMIFDIVRFNLFALDTLSASSEASAHGSFPLESKHIPSTYHFESIGSYLERNGYSEEFKNNYLIPMTAAVWSTSPDKAALDFPVITLIRFLWNHHLLSTISTRPPWKTIPGGSQRYIDAILKDFPSEHLHLRTRVNTAGNCEAGIELTFESRRKEIFDHVILATHGDTAASIISQGATSEERAIMRNFHTSENIAVLHSDRSVSICNLSRLESLLIIYKCMPKNEKTWSSWNYLTETAPSGGDVPTVSLTYWMNLLQHIPASTYGDIFVTLNPLHPPKPETIQGSWVYHHPLYTPSAMWSQEQLPRIQNRRGISYAGAWTKYGFHEDGFSSGLKVAVEHLGAKLPFEFVDSTFSRGRRPLPGVGNYCARITVQIIHVTILLMGLLFENLGLGKWLNHKAPQVKKE
jgi:predicted NAD/FAD-binding protein